MCDNTDRKTAIITGATSALGYYLVKNFALKGYNLILFMNQNIIKRQTIEKELSSNFPDIKFSFFCGSLEDFTQVSHFLKIQRKKFGNISVLINNAAVSLNKPIIKCENSEYDFIYQINLKAVFQLTQIVLKKMIKQKNGHIINISSIQALQGASFNSVYSATKSALIGFSKTIAKEYGQNNIKSNVILPGFLLSKMTADLPNSLKNNIQNSNCLKRINDPEEVASFILFITTTNNISGQVFNLDSRIIP